MKRGPRNFAMRLCIALADFVAAEALATSTRLMRSLEIARREELRERQDEIKRRLQQYTMN